MSWLGAIGGMGMEAASAWYSNRKAEQRQHEAFDQSKWMMQNRYQMQVNDLKAAGLNPMLAVSQGAPMPSVPSPAPVTKPEISNTFNQTKMVTAQTAKMSVETEGEQIKNEISKNTALLTLQTMQKVNAEIEQINQKIKVDKATESEILRRTELLNVQKELVKAQADLASQEKRIKTPEEIASGQEGAAQAATVKRILQPLIDILGGAVRAGRFK